VEVRHESKGALLGTLELLEMPSVGTCITIPLASEIEGFDSLELRAHMFAPWSPVFSDELLAQANDRQQRHPNDVWRFVEAEIQRYRDAQYVALRYDGDPSLLRRLKGFEPA
jgi:hypothetical protein